MSVPATNRPWSIHYTAFGDYDGIGHIEIIGFFPATLSTTIPCIASLTWYDWRAHFKTVYDRTACKFVSNFTLITMTEDMRDGCTLNGGDPATPTLEVTGVDDRGYQMLTLYVATGYWSSLELFAKRGEAWSEKREPFSKREKAELGAEDERLGNEHWCETDGCEDECLDSGTDEDFDAAAANADKGLEDEDVEADKEIKRIQDEVEAELNKRRGRKHKKDKDDDYFEVMVVKKPKQRVD
ncbi:MAG: hypothetical protein LQ346_002182 [Caloplaca aetnensis]|nr:MAG: hypothetical protein LQ346_002182 [Caloplaca aetnensis]